jgi:hypothetical protein
MRSSTSIQTIPAEPVISPGQQALLEALVGVATIQIRELVALTKQVEAKRREGLQLAAQLELGWQAFTAATGLTLDDVVIDADGHVSIPKYCR